MIVTSIIVQFDSLVLECNIPESIPQVTVEWTHKGSSVSGSDNRIGVTLGGKLVLSWFNPNVDLGFAHCFVSNSVTEDRVMSSSILLTKSMFSIYPSPSLSFILFILYSSSCSLLSLPSLYSYPRSV